METQRSPQYLALIASEPTNHLDAVWLKDAVDAAARRLSVADVLGLEHQVELVAVDGRGESSLEALDRSAFMIVLCLGRGQLSPEVNGKIERFLARPTQTGARDYLIPVVIPVDGPSGWPDRVSSAPLQERLKALPLHWIPTLQRRPDDEKGTAWARVTEQIVVLMARVLMSVVHTDDRERWTVRSDRTKGLEPAVASARSVVAEIEAHQLSLHTAHAHLDEAATELITQCIDAAIDGLAQRRFDSQRVQAELHRATDAYYEALETVVEEAALRTFATERRAEGIRRQPMDPDAFIPRLDPILSELYDSIAPEPRGREGRDRPASAPLAAIARGWGERRVGVALGLMLGPIGALVGGLIGAAREHRRKKDTLTTSVREQTAAIVDRARTFADTALESIADELRGLKLQWQARVDVLEAALTNARGAEPTEIVECSVLAPSSAERDRSIFVVVSFEPCSSFGPVTAESSFQTLAIRVAQRQILAVHLSLPSGFVSEPVKRLTWQGTSEAIGFAVHVPKEWPGAELVGVAQISVDGVPLGEISIAIPVVDRAPGLERQSVRPIGRAARLFEFAFIAFADDDYEHASEKARALTANRVPYMVGRFSPTLVDHWRETMLQAIDRCDLFLFCWSSFAAQSTWMQTECQRVLERHRDHMGDVDHTGPTGSQIPGPAIVPFLADAATPPPPSEEWMSLPVDALSRFSSSSPEVTEAEQD